jgi:hypothetical protein
VKTKSPIFAFILFCFFFAGFGLFYLFSIQVLMRQYRAQSFPETNGRILGAEVIEQRGSKGSVSYHPEFSYTYEVNGRSYQGQRYRYGSGRSNRATVVQIVNAHPVDSAVKVYYDPDNPADACLSPMVMAQDVSFLFLFMPIILMFLGQMLKHGREINWPGRSEPVAGGVKILAEMMTTRVRLPRYRPAALSLITAGSLSLLASGAIQFVFKFSPVPAGWGSLLIVLAAAASVYLWQCQRLATGIQDLVIDQGARTVELPLTYKRRERRRLPFISIRAVTLEPVAHRGRYGVTYTYAPTLQMSDGSAERLTDLSEIRAESFAVWLRHKLEVPG